MIHFIKKHLVIFVIGIVIVVGLFVIRHHETTQIEEEAFASVDLQEEVVETKEMVENETSLVDIKGEVKNPGVYELESSARVNDVIDLAGGFTKEANQAFINLAQKVQDEMVIIVPKEGDDDGLTDTPLGSGSNNEEQKISINNATKEEIETLPGIGPSKAQAIIDYREENGAFQQLDDLLQVSGIGDKTLENVQDQIAIP